MPDRAPDRAIDGLARRQHGAFHRRQAVRIGFTDRMIARRLAAGRWIRLADSQVFALPSHPGTWERQCVAAVLSVPASAVSGPAGAAVLGFPGWPRAAIEVVTRYGTTTRSPFAAVRRSRTVGRFVVVDGIRVVSHADCLIQLAAHLDTSRLGALVDDVAIGRPSVLGELRDRFAAVASSRLPGSDSLRTVLDERSDGEPVPQGELGRVLTQVLASVPGLPTVLIEHTPPWLERGNGRVDVLVPAWRLVVEADGRTWHTRVDDFERDRWRDAQALAHGYATLRFTWRQLVASPAECRNILVAAGLRRAA